jgi:serine/threonine protein kinase
VKFTVINSTEVRLLLGASFGFAGLATTDRPHLDMLGPILPLFYHRHDIDMRATVARFFGAYKNAARSLEEYYTVELPRIRGLFTQPNPLFPYKNSYMPLADKSTLQYFEYTRSLCADDHSRLIFYGKTVGHPEAGKLLCIKFVRRYSKAAHECCASQGYAPTLYGFEELAGGWYMVVMEELDQKRYSLYCNICSNPTTISNEYHQQIRDALSKCIHHLHNSGMVHGDIRDNNLLICTDDTPDIKLIDFDWAGEVNVVRYPMNVNHIGIRRPDTAYDGELVKKEHDLDMIDYMFYSTV